MKKLINIVLVLFCLVFQNAAGSFVRRSGIHIVKDGRPFYINGFNAYWLMHVGYDHAERAKVSSIFQHASSFGLNVARTWAFSDGGYRPLQYKPGQYNEDMFKSLDFVVTEARKQGVYLILSLVNNYENYGGRKQYVDWARQGGNYLASDDEFYRNPVVKAYYKNHAKAILTRVNSLTGVVYKDDPTIFAWELINEPQCQSDLSGATVQDWITEMSAYVKSIDSNHLLEVGLEGFYGGSTPGRMQFNPGYQLGTDFISNHQIPGIDFSTIHVYPDQWLAGTNEQVQTAFLERWLEAHIQDANSALGKPLLVAEFGKSSSLAGTNISQRDAFLGIVYNSIYNSAKSGGSCAGGLFWQLMAKGMDNMRDGYEIVLEESPCTANIIDQQSKKISALN